MCQVSNYPQLRGATLASKVYVQERWVPMLLKDGPGLRPAAACAERCFLNGEVPSLFCSVWLHLVSFCLFLSSFLPPSFLCSWADKKLDPNRSLQASETLASPQPNTMLLKDGPGLWPNVAFWTDKKPRHSKTMLLKDGPAFGPRLPVPNVAFWCCLNGQETSSKLKPSNLQDLGLATAKHHATEGRAVPSANGCLCLTLLSERTRS